MENKAIIKNDVAVTHTDGRQEIYTGVQVDTRPHVLVLFGEDGKTIFPYLNVKRFHIGPEIWCYTEYEWNREEIRRKRRLEHVHVDGKCMKDRRGTCRTEKHEDVAVGAHRDG